MSISKQVRTTVSLPAAALSAAKKAAKENQVNLSTVMAEALEAFLKQRQAREHAKAALARYQRVLGNFSEEERMILDGIMMEPRKGKR